MSSTHCLVPVNARNQYSGDAQPIQVSHEIKHQFRVGSSPAVREDLAIADICGDDD
jgi:hypothetical protein